MLYHSGISWVSSLILLLSFFIELLDAIECINGGQLPVETVQTLHMPGDNFFFMHLMSHANAIYTYKHLILPQFILNINITKETIMPNV